MVCGAEINGGVEFPENGKPYYCGGTTSRLYGGRALGQEGEAGGNSPSDGVKPPRYLNEPGKRVFRGGTAS